VAGIWLAAMAGADAQALVAGVIGVDWMAAVLARLGLVLTCLLLCLIAGWGIERTLEGLHMGWLNRMAGALLAGVVGIILLSLVVGVADRLAPQWDDWTEQSLLTDQLESVSDLMMGPEPQDAEAEEELSEPAAPDDGAGDIPSESSRPSADPMGR
jgi:uncharacterized membrane protein required for colicin V production